MTRITAKAMLPPSYQPSLIPCTEIQKTLMLNTKYLFNNIPYTKTNEVTKTPTKTRKKKRKRKSHLSLYA